MQNRKKTFPAIWKMNRNLTDPLRLPLLVSMSLPWGEEPLNAKFPKEGMVIIVSRQGF